MPWDFRGFCGALPPGQMNPHRTANDSFRKYSPDTTTRRGGPHNFTEGWPGWPGWPRLAQVGPSWPRSAQVRYPRSLRSLHLSSPRNSHLSPSVFWWPHTVYSVRPGWPRLAQVGPGWPRLAQVGAGWSKLAQFDWSDFSSTLAGPS